MSDNPHLDAESELVKECFAVVYAPRRQRTRFPENCVQTFDSVQEVTEKANPSKHFYPAKVIGPSRSSEGFRLYYLVQWLD
jgi:hypothetical protein